MGLEGLVSKHRDSAYRGGRLDLWIKVMFWDVLRFPSRNMRSAS
jgi:ATP-dependent DNA ligase